MVTNTNSIPPQSSGLVGSVLHERYRILAPIGRGGAAVVYLAEDISTPLSRKLAVKAVRKEGSSAIISDVRQEMAILDQVVHQGVTAIQDFFEDEKTVYIVMAYVPGSTLKQIVDVGGAQDERDVIKWGITLCETLSYLHERGIAHCDVNPKNVMLDDSGNLHLMDFGTAEMITGRPSTRPPLGTKGFAAPEQHKGGSRILDARTDVYGLGCTLINLASGKIPRMAKETKDLKTSPGFLAVMEKATSYNPADRYQTIHEMADDLRRLSSLDEKRVRELKRGVMITLISGVITLALIATCLVLWHQESESRKSLGAQYVTQAVTLTQDGDIQGAQEAYLKAIDLDPKDGTLYTALFDLLLPGEDSLSYEAQVKTALDALRYAGNPRYFEDELLMSALGRAMTLSEPVYRNCAEDLLDEIDSRGIGDKLTEVYRASLNEDDDGAKLAEELYEDRDQDASDRLDALFIAAGGGYVPDAGELSRLEEESGYTRTIPLHTLLAGQAYSRWLESGSQKDIDVAYQWIRSYDSVYSETGRLLRARIDTAKGDYADAKAVYREMIASDPDSTSALLGLIETVCAEQDAKGTKDYSEAMGAYQTLSQAVNLSSEAISQLNAFKIKAGI